MATVKAFPALRFTEKSGDISKNVCPPYDIVNDTERQQYISHSENNIIRLEKPIGENAYNDAKELYLEWRKQGIIDTDEKCGIYAYEEEFEVFDTVKKFKGIFVRVKLEEFEKGIVLPHEETLSKAKEDRFNLMCATYCNFSPIYCMYTDADRNITSRIEDFTKGKPEIEFTAPDGVIQRLWITENESDIEYLQKAFQTKQLFIADGHHRYETALRFRNKLISDGVILDENHPANFVEMFLVDMENDGLVVFPTHRIIKGLESFDEKVALEKIKEYFDVCEIEEKDVEKSLLENVENKAFVMCTKDEKFSLLTMKNDGKAKDKINQMNPSKAESYKELDVTVLHSLILENILGIDKENMAKQINLSYTRSIDEAKMSVKENDVNCAFLINATKVSQIKDVALAGEKMPQKSTYFYPKLITGLVMNQLLPYENI